LATDEDYGCCNGKTTGLQQGGWWSMVEQGGREQVTEKEHWMILRGSRYEQ